MVLDADLIATNGGNDFVYGLAGDDRIEISGSGDVVVDTGEGADEIVIAEDAQGSIEIISGGHGDTLLWEAYTGDVTYAHINESGDLVFGTQDLDVILTDQMSYDSDVGKYVVSGVETITVEFGDLGDDDDRISESVSAVVGSDYKEGDLLYTNSATEHNVILAGAGADTIMVGSGNDVAEHTAIVGDLYNYQQDSAPFGTLATYEFEAANWTNRDSAGDEPYQLKKVGDTTIKLHIREDDIVVEHNGREFSIGKDAWNEGVDPWTQTTRIGLDGYTYDEMNIEVPQHLNILSEEVNAEGKESEGFTVLLSSTNPEAPDTYEYHDMKVAFVDGRWRQGRSRFVRRDPRH